jgi:adenine-specific DNA-methyltransferase
MDVQGHSMRYIGSKTSTLPWLAAFVAERAPEARSLCDPFAGTCTVARHFKGLGFRVITGDVLSLSYVIQVATIGLNAVPAFRKLQHIGHIRNRKEPTAGGRVFGYLNSLRTRKRYLSEHFSAKAGRLYFTDNNAGKIDAMREEIAKWEAAGLVSEDERAFLLASLISAADKVANTAGTYYAHLKQLSRKAKKSVKLQAPPVFNNGRRNRCHRVDARTLAALTKADILYLDPPYNERDYGGYYHLPESLARGDAPLPAGRSGAPQERRLERSDFCRPGYAASALEELVFQAKARYILVHYTTNGLVEHERIMTMLRRRGSASYRDLPVRAYSSRRNGIQPIATHRVYWCKVRESRTT